MCKCQKTDKGEEKEDRENKDVCKRKKNPIRKAA